MSAVLKIDERPNLSAEIANRLRDMIFDGDLAEGVRINEVHLAAQLGVSRTPLREALTTLAAENALDSIPRRGFFVRKLTREEFEDIYPLRAILDPAALRLSGVPSPEGFKRLENLNRKIQTAKDYKTRISFDEAWHLELVSNCQNRTLLDLIELFMRKFRRYGLAFHQNRDLVKALNQEHVKIIEALKNDDMDRACDWLRKNFTSDKNVILDWLGARSRPE